MVTQFCSHVSSENDHRKHIFSKMHSRGEVFKSAILLCSCGQLKPWRRFLKIYSWFIRSGRAWEKTKQHGGRMQAVCFTPNWATCTICKHQAFFSAAFFMSVVPGDYVGRRRNIITLLSAVVSKTGGKRWSIENRIHGGMPLNTN